MLIITKPSNEVIEITKKISGHPGWNPNMDQYCEKPIHIGRINLRDSRVSWYESKGYLWDIRWLQQVIFETKDFTSSFQTSLVDFEVYVHHD